MAVTKNGPPCYLERPTLDFHRYWVLLINCEPSFDGIKCPPGITDDHAKFHIEKYLKLPKLWPTMLVISWILPFKPLYGDNFGSSQYFWNRIFAVSSVMPQADRLIYCMRKSTNFNFLSFMCYEILNWNEKILILFMWTIITNSIGWPDQKSWCVN